MTLRRRLFAGPRLRSLRETQAIRQAEMARHLGISASYLSQLEHDDRPLTPQLIERLAVLFPLDWQDIGLDDADRLHHNLREAASDPLFGDTLPDEQLVRFVEQQPALSERFITLHDAYRHACQRLEMLDEALSTEELGGSRFPWEEVRDWFHFANNYIDPLDRAAEKLAASLDHEGSSPSTEALESYLLEALGVTLSYSRGATLRAFEPATRTLSIDLGQPAESRRFQLAHQLAALDLTAEISEVVGNAHFRSDSSKQLLNVGLCNYAAGALLMPYNPFRAAARKMRHDIDRLAQAFGTSFEQTCHRLSTLQREGALGVPFFFCRVDMAGNITKRHSATRLQFARFGGACPLWIVHEAVAIPDRILVQLAEMPDGARYVSMAKGLVKPSGSFERAPRRYAVALGCETRHASEFIYAAGLDLSSDRNVTRIGASCRICPREDCDQRSFPPSDRPIEVDPERRGVVPYRF